jgi:hypothetical protein
VRAPPQALPRLRAALAPVGGVLASLPWGDGDAWGAAPVVPNRPADAGYADPARRRLGQGGEGGVAVLLNKGDFCGNDARA